LRTVACAENWHPAGFHVSQAVGLESAELCGGKAAKRALQKTQAIQFGKSTSSQYHTCPKKTLPDDFVGRAPIFRHDVRLTVAVDWD